MSISRYHHSFVHHRCKPAERIAHINTTIYVSTHQVRLHTRGPPQEGNHKELSDAVGNGVILVLADACSHFFPREFSLPHGSANQMTELHAAIESLPGCTRFVGAVRDLSVSDRFARASIINPCWRHYLHIAMHLHERCRPQGQIWIDVLSLCSIILEGRKYPPETLPICQQPVRPS